MTIIFNFRLNLLNNLQPLPPSSPQTPFHNEIAMATERQISASRANGALSHGPATSAGKIISAQNARRHGLCAESPVIDGEMPDAHSALRSEIFDTFRPTNACEVELAEIAAMAIWRLNRTWGIELAVLNGEIRKQPGGLPADRAAAAFRELVDNSRVLDVLHRYDSRFERQYHRAMNQLARQRGCKTWAELKEANLPNEPAEHLSPIPSTN